MAMGLKWMTGMMDCVKFVAVIMLLIRFQLFFIMKLSCLTLSGFIDTISAVFYKRHRFCKLLIYCRVLQKRYEKVQGVPQSQVAPLPGHQEVKETDKTRQAQIEQTYEKH